MTKKPVNKTVFSEVCAHSNTCCTVEFPPLRIAMPSFKVEATMGPISPGEKKPNTENNGPWVLYSLLIVLPPVLSPLAFDLETDRGPPPSLWMFQSLKCVLEETRSKESFVLYD